MQEIPVAVLDVDEAEAHIPRSPRREDEGADELLDLGVAQDRGVIPHAGALVQQRVAVRDSRLGAVLAVRPREAAGVRQLQPDQEARAGAEAPLVRFHERAAQAVEAAEGMLGREKLVGVGPALLAHRDRFAAPDQLGAALAESTPALQGQLSGIAVGLAVPALHRLNHPAIADLQPGHLERRRQRGVLGAQDLVVDGNVRGDRGQVAPELTDALEGTDARKAAHDRQ